jgi:hypothetical protein
MDPRFERHLKTLRIIDKCFRIFQYVALVLSVVEIVFLMIVHSSFSNTVTIAIGLAVANLLLYIVLKIVRKKFLHG